MNQPVPQLVLFTAIPVVATVLGGVIAAYRPPGARLRSIVQHIAAGVVFAAAAGELLPDIVERHRPWEMALGFGSGIGLMLLIRALAERRRTDAAAATPVGLLATLGTDIFIDGLLIGIGFAAGAEEGMLLSLALTLELLFLGLSASTAMSSAGASKGRVIAVTAGLALVLAVGTALGVVVLGELRDEWMEQVLSFGLAALLYLVTEELLVEAHEVPETPLTTAAFFAGFLALILIEMVALPGGG